MAGRALALREGFAPIRDRLLATLFLAGILHALVILGVTFNVADDASDGAPGLPVLLVSDELPSAESNETAAYLAQRAQIGSGNTLESVAPRNRASQRPVEAREGVDDGELDARANDTGRPADERVLTT